MTVAISLQLLLLVYYQLTTRYDFHPFNGVRFWQPGERYTEAAINFTLMVLPLPGYLFNISSLMRFGAVFYFILFAREIASWFVPYFFGASAKWQDVYSRVQGRTITLIPPRGQNPTPNFGHLILMALTVGTGIATFTAYWSLPDASAKGWPVAAGIAAFMLYGIGVTHWKLPKKSAGNRAS